MTSADPETISWLRVVMSFGIVFGLLGILGYALKYISQRGMKFPGMAARSERLQIVESLTLDVRRRLVIVKCDGVEHLLLLGVNQDIVIESDLTHPSLSTVSPLQTKSAH
jgi:flagellar protein FliO/FliZ